MWRRLLTVFIVMLFAPHVAHAACISPAGAAGEITYNADSGVPQYCDDTNWIAMSGIEQSGPSDCPNPGDVCSDSTVFAGISPDGNLQMFTTAADLGTARWSNGNDVTGYTSNTDGDGNTEGLATYAGAGTPYTAALDCYNSTADGYSDWYLPARDELSVLYDNRIAIGGFTLTADYWSSSENSSNNAREVGFNDGVTGNLNKGTTVRIRCVRKRSTEMTEVVPSGLVGHWRLDETSGTTATDSSGNGNDGTMLGSLDAASDSVDGVVGQSLNFNGTNDYIDISSLALSSASEVTMTAWIYSDNVGTAANFKGIVMSRGGDDSGFQVSNYSGTVGQIGYHWNNGGYSWNSGLYVNPKEWSFVAWTVDSAKAVLYLGVPGSTLQSATRTAAHTPANFLNARIGDDEDQPTRWFRGNIDDVRIYNRALTATEIQEIYLARDGIRYNKNAHTPEYFDGNKWAAMIPPWPEPYSGPSTYPATQYSSSLIGYWKLDEITYTSAADSSGNGHNGSLLNGLDPTSDSVTGAIRTALTFDGIDDTILVSSNAAFDIATSGSFSQFIWFKKTTDCGANAGADNEVMMNRWGSGYTNRTWWFGCRASTDNLEINFYGSASSVSVTGPVIDDGVWHHGGWVYDGSAGTVRLYLDGIEYNSASYTLDANMNVANPICIGGYDNTCSDSRFFFDGELDDARIYNRALSTTEIQNMYNQTSSLYQGLVGHWKLDEITGTTATDSSGNGNDGTMQNGMDAADDSTLGAVGSSLEFSSATNHYIDLGTAPELKASAVGTWSLWAYRYSVGNSQGLLHVGNLGYNSKIGIITRDTARIEVRGRSGSEAYPYTWHVSSADNSFPVNTWTHIVLVQNGTTPRLYINGVEDTTSVGGSDLTWWTNQAEYSADSFYIGGDAGGGEFLGRIDDVRIYDRALSATEVQDLYKMGRPLGSSTALPQGCPNIGDVCDDGTIYAGLAPEDGTTPMFAVSFDSPTTLPWNNNNTSGHTLTNITNNDTGEANTSSLVTLDSDSVTAGFQTHQAAQYCYDLHASGADDWYLPTWNEINVMLNNHIAFGITPDRNYWISDEMSTTNARRKWYESATQSVGTGNNPKEADFYVRCVRKGPAPRCANPYGLEGAMLYNADHTVVQYCDGARWISIGKRQ